METRGADKQQHMNDSQSETQQQDEDDENEEEEEGSQSNNDHKSRRQTSSKRKTKSKYQSTVFGSRKRRKNKDQHINQRRQIIHHSRKSDEVNWAQPDSDYGNTGSRNKKNNRNNDDSENSSDQESESDIIFNKFVIGSQRGRSKSLADDHDDDDDNNNRINRKVNQQRRVLRKKKSMDDKQINKEEVKDKDNGSQSSSNNEDDNISPSEEPSPEELAEYGIKIHDHELRSTTKKLMEKQKDYENNQNDGQTNRIQLRSQSPSNKPVIGSSSSSSSTSSSLLQFPSLVPFHTHRQQSHTLLSLLGEHNYEPGHKETTIHSQLLRYLADKEKNKKRSRRKSSSNEIINGKGGKNKNKWRVKGKVKRKRSQIDKENTSNNNNTDNTINRHSGKIESDILGQSSIEDSEQSSDTSTEGGRSKKIKNQSSSERERKKRKRRRFNPSESESVSDSEQSTQTERSSLSIYGIIDPDKIREKKKEQKQLKKLKKEKQKSDYEDGIFSSSLTNRDRHLHSHKRADITPVHVDESITFSSVGGLQQQIHALYEMVVLPLLYPSFFARFGTQPPRGVLLHGPPGTGKTLLVRALAAACN
ncbi:MAG: putative ATPase with bromodomain protein [Streblomastix strix]|uniref:Putative ATPase with bromodomain protein n=1 Tax=Streblomastix strix TaxID=222440 RepID=A0A5J4WN23_9EUKA|nr:MAG: putative ATPase with bromodomain protein [Streblomastix strix]